MFGWKKISAVVGTWINNGAGQYQGLDILTHFAYRRPSWSIRGGAADYCCWRGLGEVRSSFYLLNLTSSQPETT